MKNLILLMLLALSFSSIASNKGLEHSDLYVGNLEVLKAKIKAGVDLTESVYDEYYEPPLQVAIYEDNLEAVQVILESGGYSYIDTKCSDVYKSIPTSCVTSLFNVASGRTENPKDYYDLLLRYIDIEKYIDEVLFYIVASSDDGISIVKDLVRQGANPTRVLTTREIGTQSSALYKSWSSMESGRSTIFYEYLVNQLAESEQITENQVFEKYVKPIHDRNTTEQECC